MEELMKLLAPFFKEDADVGGISKSVTKFVEDYSKIQTTNLAKERDEFRKKSDELGVQYNEYKEKYGTFDEEGVSYDGYKQLVSDFEALKNSASQTDTTKIFQDAYNQGKDSQKKAMEPEMAKLQKAMEKVSDERENYKKNFINMNKEMKLKDAIEKMGVRPNEFVLDGLRSRMQTEYNDVEGSLTYRMLHDGNYIPLEDFIQQFPNTDVGKSMIPAPVNTGGGAGGSRGAGSQGKYTIEDLPKLSEADRVVALKEMGIL